MAVDFLLSDEDIEELTEVHDSALFDTCVLQTRTEGNTAYGYGKPSYEDSDESEDCLFVATPKQESTGAQALITDAKIRLKKSATVINSMRLKMTCVHGVNLIVPQVYEIVAGPVTNHVGQEVGVRLVTDGSQS